MQNKKLKIYALFLLALVSTASYAQESINAAGGDASGTGGSVSFSVGQLNYHSQESASGSVTEGVQQAYEISSLSVNDVAKDMKLEIYPNPASDFLQLKIETGNLSDLHYQLIDSQGHILFSEKIKNRLTAIDMRRLPTALYFVQVNSGSEHLQTFKILKK